MGALSAILQPSGKSRRNRREACAFYLFVSPWIIGFFVFSLGPILAAAYFSLTNLQALNVNDGFPHFVGLHNYQILLQDRTFSRSVEATAIFTFGGIALNTVLGILLAQLLNQQIPGVRLLRTIYYMPVVIAGVAAALVWTFLLGTDNGLINSLLKGVHIQGPAWLANESAARIAMLLYNAWYVGQSMVLYLAALQGVPTTLYEAASLDGANAIRRFWHVTIPMISPIILFNVITGAIGLLQAFVPPFIMTQGGPNYATYLFGFAIFQQAFTYEHGGYASAWAMVLFLFSMLLTVTLFLVARRFVYYQSEREGAL